MNKFEITDAEHRDIVRNGTKTEQRNVLNAMVNEYLYGEKQGVITRFEQGGHKTFWAINPETGNLEELK